MVSCHVLRHPHPLSLRWYANGQFQDMIFKAFGIKLGAPTRLESARIEVPPSHFCVGSHGGWKWEPNHRPDWILSSPGFADGKNCSGITFSDMTQLFAVIPIPVPAGWPAVRCSSETHFLDSHRNTTLYLSLTQIYFPVFASGHVACSSALDGECCWLGNFRQLTISVKWLHGLLFTINRCVALVWMDWKKMEWHKERHIFAMKLYQFQCEFKKLITK